MIASAFLTALAVAGTNAAVIKSVGAGYVNYTTVTGYFLQDESSTNASTFDYTATNFGLINRTYPILQGDSASLTQWQQFAIQVDALNKAAPLNTVYKVLFMGRHGEGYHNAAQTYYGTPGWNCYWAELKGNSTNTWADAALTPNGVNQAQIAHNFWKSQFANQHMPYPQSYYTSPLTRCLQTANITFSGLDLPDYYPFVPTVKEYLREGISIHTCDHRSNKTYIANTFPSYVIERGFNEYDELWDGITAETTSAQQLRSLVVLNEIFESDDHTWVSITSHSGEIASLLSVLGHQPFSLNTGAVIPVLVKAVFLPASAAPATTVQPFTTSTWCHNGPPITSNVSLAQGCVCASTTAALPSLDTQAPYVSGQTAPINEFTTTTTITSGLVHPVATSTVGKAASSSSSDGQQGGWPFPPWGAKPTWAAWQ